MNNLGLFAGLPSLYTEAVLNNPAKYQPVVAENLGLAKFFNWTNLRWVTALSLALCTLSSVGLVMLQHIKKWRIDMNRVLLVALKLVTVFYVNFLIIPYPYLFYVSSFITLMLFCELYKESKKKTL